MRSFVNPQSRRRFLGRRHTIYRRLLSWQVGLSKRDSDIYHDGRFRYRFPKLSLIKFLERRREKHDRRAICRLIALAKDEQFDVYGREQLPLLYRDLYWLGDLGAGLKFARELDAGHHLPRALDRATQIYTEVRDALTFRAASGDRTAMSQLADMYAHGLGSPDVDELTRGVLIEREWRIAMDWWLTAAGAGPPAGPFTNPDDLSEPEDEISASALLKIGQLFEQGRGLPTDIERARRIYRLVGHAGFERGSIEAARMDADWFHSWWLNSGEPKYGEKNFYRNLSVLQEHASAGNTQAHRCSLGWEAWKKIEGGPPWCDVFETQFCASMSEILAQRNAALMSGAEGDSAEAYRLLEYLQLTRPTRFCPRALSVDGDEEDRVVVGLYFKKACDSGFGSSLSEQEFFADHSRTRGVLRQKDELHEHIREAAQVFIGLKENAHVWVHEAGGMGTNCQLAISSAQATFIRELVKVGKILSDQKLLDYVAIRCQLANLQNDLTAEKWRETLIFVQLHNPDIRRRLNDEVPERAPERRPAGWFDRMMGRGRQPINDKAARSEIDAASLLRAIEASTRDVGPIYNELSPDNGVPQPGINRNLIDASARGWRSVDSIVIGERGWRVEGVSSAAHEVPFIFDEDVAVLLACQYLEQADQSLSIEPFERDFSNSVLSLQFCKKV